LPSVSVVVVLYSSVAVVTIIKSPLFTQISLWNLVGMRARDVVVVGVVVAGAVEEGGTSTSMMLPPLRFVTRTMDSLEEGSGREERMVSVRCLR